MIQNDRWRATAVCAALVLGTVALYWPAFAFGFVNVDDALFVAANPHVNNGLRGALGWAFQTDYAAAWQPVTWISHALDCQIFGSKAGGHHAINVALHAVNSALVFLVLRRLTGAFWRSAAVAAFFAWHPLHVEPVAWIAERKGLLCAFFWLLALWAYVRYTENLKSRIPSFKFFYAGALLLFALALMSKPVAVTLPCVLLLLDWWPLGRLGAAATPGQPGAGRQAVALLAEKIPFFVLSAASSAATIIAVRHGGLLSAAEQLPFKKHVVAAALSYFRYLAKSFWPSDLGLAYPYLLQHSRVETIFVVLVLALVSIVAIGTRKSRPYWLVGWLWFAGVLFPAMNLTLPAAQPMADRYMYIPSIGLWMLICWEAYDLVASWRYGRVALGALCAILLAACCVSSSMQLRYWQSEESLISCVPESKYNPIAHTRYVAYLMDHNQLPKAEAECQKAIALFPGYSPLELTLGEIFLRQNRVDQAIEKLRSVLRTDPGLLGAHLLFGRALLAKNQPGDAAEQFKQVLHYEPKNIEAHNWLARTFLMQGKAANAAAEYRASLTLQLNQPVILNDLAWLLATDPRPEIRNGVEAVQLAERACALTRSQQPALLGTLAAAYAEAGQFGKAVEAGEKAHELAVKHGMKALAERNDQLLKLYHDHKPFHENPPPAH